MKLLVVILVIVCIGVPLSYAWRIVRLDERSRAAWLIVVADALVVTALVLLVGRWDIVGYYTRFVLLAILLVAVLWSWVRHAKRSWQAPAKPVWRSHWTTVVSLVAFGVALIYILSGVLPPAQPRELTLPLKGARFMVGQGGTLGLLNHHAGHRQQRYAADITAINAAGFRATGVLPGELDRYVVYGASVVSPCDGRVRHVRGGLPDLHPPDADADNPAGNHVIISCSGIEVELAHLQEHSIEVQVGDELRAGEPIGRVGNSGNTTEPHLHIHAVDPETGGGVPIAFEGRMPIRNRVFREDDGN